MLLSKLGPMAVQAGASVAPESAARTDDGTLGGVGFRGVTRAPTVDTNTAGTVECAVHAGGRRAGGSDAEAEGCGMGARGDFEVFERAVETEAVGSGGEAGADVADGTAVRCGACLHGAFDVAGGAIARRTGSEMLGAGGRGITRSAPNPSDGHRHGGGCRVRGPRKRLRRRGARHERQRGVCCFWTGGFFGNGC